MKSRVKDIKKKKDLIFIIVRIKRSDAGKTGNIGAPKADLLKNNIFVEVRLARQGFVNILVSRV